MVIDSSIFIEYFRAKDKRQTAFLQIPDDTPIFMSSVTAYELYIGSTTPDKRAFSAEMINGCKVLYLDTHIAAKAADIFIGLRKKNLLIEHRDIFIAATALVHNLPLKTLNIKHFSRIDGLLFA